ncbi:hypothetical protein [Agrococcus lahaulensis]|uniref:hypothetical protein n=1 Tax=Agrococcus lahaulensis TaxID=341722 RepID=UPI00047A0791|nr:hypothetical protein [Agrococcus lahaulensis]
MTSQIDLAGIFIDGFASVPAQFAAMYAAAPESWNAAGLGLLALAGVAFVARRARGRSLRSH